MAHELVFIAQAIGVEDAVFIHDDGVFQRTATRQAHAAQAFHVLHEAKGARARHVVHIRHVAEVDGGALHRAIDGRMIEFDEEVELEAVVRRQARPFLRVTLAVTHFHGLDDLDEFLRRLLLFHASLLQQVDEGRGGTIHDGNFFRIHVDVHIIDAQAGRSRHQMLHGRNPGAILDQHGSHARIAHGHGAGGKLDDGIEVDAAKHDARIDRGGTQGQLDLGARVQTDTDGADLLFDSALF